MYLCVCMCVCAYVCVPKVFVLHRSRVAHDAQFYVHWWSFTGGSDSNAHTCAPVLPDLDGGKHGMAHVQFPSDIGGRHGYDKRGALGILLWSKVAT